MLLCEREDLMLIETAPEETSLTAMEPVDLGEFPAVIRERLVVYLQDNLPPDDNYWIHNPELSAIHLLERMLQHYWMNNGLPDQHFESTFDHWGSIEGGLTLVIEPYMYPEMWSTFEIVADVLRLSIEFIADSVHNGKPEGDDVLLHSYCSRICFRVIEEDYLASKTW